MITNQIKSIILNVVFLGIGIGALVLLSDKFDLTKIDLSQVTYGSLSIVLVATFFAYLFRAKRWQMLLENNQSKQKTYLVANSMFYGYFVNLALPRAGELSKSLLYQKYSGLKFPFILGTVVLERIIDVLMLLVLFIVYSIVDSEIYSSFYEKWVVLTPFQHYFELKYFLVAGLSFSVGLIIFWRYIKPVLEHKWKNFSDGLFKIHQLKNKGVFIIYTIGIWCAYFFTSYGCFGMVDTSLGIRAGVALLVLGSFARSVPVQAGSVGVYHFIVVLVLTLPIFGESEEQALLIATLIHAIQTLVQVVMGIVSVILNTFFLRKIRYL